MFQANRHGCRILEFTSGGNQFLSMENDLLKVVFWLNKGADIVEIRHKPKDLDVMWRTPLPMPASGSYISPAAAPIGHYFDYYPGGWQEVFPNAHLPTAEYKRAPLGLHGEVCLLPWSYRTAKDSEARIVVEMTVRTARTPFRLTRTVTMQAGEPWFVFDETIQNDAKEPMHYNWGHHPVFGAPFIQAGCIIDAPERSVAVLPDDSASAAARLTPGQRSEWPHLLAENGEKIDASVILGEEAGSADSFYLEVKEGWAAIRNPSIDLGVGFAWETDVFPYLWVWQAYCGSPGYPFYKRNYNVAIEPYSVPVETLSESVASGTAHLLEAGAARSTKLLFRFTDGRERIRSIRLDGTYEKETSQP